MTVNSMTIQRFVREAMLVLAVVMLVTGCRSFYEVDIHTPAGLRAVHPGELVRVTTHVGEEREFTVTHVEQDRIAGESASYTATQIATLERDEQSPAKTAAFTTGVWAVATIVTAVLFAAAFTAAVFG